MAIYEIVFSGNVAELERVLRGNPSLALEDIPLPDNSTRAHPLHRVCDGVFNKNYSEETGVDLAKVLIKYGADVNGVKQPGRDSPMIAACSLYCDELALLYLEHGATIDHQGCHGGTALHWAAWCGRDVIVNKLLKMNPDINKLCIDFKSTPLFWALHGYRFGGDSNRHNQVNCARLLLEKGADPSIPNFEGYVPKQLIGPDDKELIDLFAGL